MKLTELDLPALKELVAEWLLSNEGAEAQLGLEAEEIFARAKQLKPLIAAGVVSPGEVELDEDLKDVLYALVTLVSTDPRDADSAREAQAICRFIRGISWPDDELGEKQDLVMRCAAAAQEAASAVGTAPDTRGTPAQSLSEKEARKAFLESAGLVHAILVKYHGLSELEAQQLEKDLLAWFIRFCQRPNGPGTDKRGLLLAACSHLARGYRSLESTRPLPSAAGRLGELLGWTRAENER